MTFGGYSSPWYRYWSERSRLPARGRRAAGAGALGRQGAAAEARPFSAAAAALPHHHRFPAVQLSRRRRPAVRLPRRSGAGDLRRTRTSPKNARSRRCPGPNSTLRCRRAKAKPSSPASPSPPETVANTPSPAPICSFRRASSCRRRRPSPNRSSTSCAGKRVGVVAGSAHERMLRDYFADVQVVPFDSQEDALRRPEGRQDRRRFRRRHALRLLAGRHGRRRLLPLRRRAVPCAGISGLRHGHRGARADDPALAAALDYALQEISVKGTFAEFYLRYFPVSFF